MRRLTTALALLLAAAPACTPARPTGVGESSPTPSPTPAPAIATGPATIEVQAAANLDVFTVESQIAAPLEAALADVAGLTRIESESRAEGATITLTFADGEDLARARAAVVDALGAAAPTLPAGITPILGPERAPPSERLFIALRPGDGDPRRHALGLAALRRALLGTPGVVDLELCGERREEVVIAADPARLRALGVGAAALRRALEDSLAGDAGLARGGGAPLLGAGPGIGAPGLEDISSLVVATAGAPPTPLLLRDLATLSVAPAAPPCDAALPGGRAAAVAVVWPRRGARASDLEAAIGGSAQAIAAEHDLAVLALTAGPPERLHLEIAAHEVAGETLRALARGLPGAAAGSRVVLRARTPGRAGEVVDVELLRFDPRADIPGFDDALKAIPGLRLRDVEAEEFPSRLRLRVVDDDLERAEAIAERAASIAAAAPGVYLAHSRGGRSPELALELRRDRLAALGLAPGDVARALALALDDVPVGALAGADGERLPVRLRLGDPDRVGGPARLEAAAALELPIPAGGAVPLAEVAELRLTAAPRRITRVDRQRSLDVEVRFFEDDTREAVQQAIARDLELPAGVVLVWE